MPKDLAIVGLGAVGANLARRLVASGHSVQLGARRPADLAALIAELGHAARAASPDLACRNAELVFLAVPAHAAVEAVRAAAPPAGAILVDCNHPRLFVDGPIWKPPAEGSTAAQLQAAFPALRVVKAFNHFGAELHADPMLRGGPADAFVAGDDAAARQRVLGLAAAMGFVPRDAGPLRNAAVLENLAVLWIQLALHGGLGREFSFRCEQRPAGEAR